MYDGSETIERVGFTDQTISAVLLSPPQLGEGRITHLSTHDEAGVCIVVRSGTFGCSKVVSVPKGVTNTSLCDQSNSLLASLANPEVVGNGVVSAGSKMKVQVAIAVVR